MHVLPPYFIQNKQWMEFWTSTNNNLSHKKDHAYFIFENEVFKTYIFQYPYSLSRSFWYISKGPILKSGFLEQIQHEYIKEILQKKLIELFKDITLEAQKKNIAFIKTDFDDSVSQMLSVSDIKEYIHILHDSLPFSVKESQKSIQFLASSYNYVDWSTVSCPQGSSPQHFYTQTVDIFWSKCNEKVRRYTRKALKLSDPSNEKRVWKYTREKTQDTFEQFYKIHIQTTKRQKFPTQPKEYLKSLFFSDFTESIIIQDMDSNPHCVWLGIKLNGQLVYLLGGNTEYSFKKWAQYLVHVLALQICFQNDISYYDMGGYDSSMGYGQFKDGYKGSVRKFVGVLDIVIDKRYYWIVQQLQKINSIKKKVLS